MVHPLTNIRDSVVTYRMKFADEFLTQIQSGEKTMTVRLNSEWGHVFAGDGLHVCGTDGGLFCSVGIERAETMEADDVVKICNACDGHQGYSSEDEFVESMKGYYGDCVGYMSDYRVIHFSPITGGE